MSMIQTFVNGPGSPQQDGYVQKAQPGVILNGTESLGEWDARLAAPDEDDVVIGHRRMLRNRLLTCDSRLDPN